MYNMTRYGLESSKVLEYVRTSADVCNLPTAAACALWQPPHVTYKNGCNLNLKTSLAVQ